MRILLISQAGLGSCHVLAIWVSETESHSLAQSDLGLTVKSAGQSSGLSHELQHLRKSVDTGCRGILGLSYFFCCLLPGWGILPVCACQTNRLPLTYTLRLINVTCAHSSQASIYYLKPSLPSHWGGAHVAHGKQMLYHWYIPAKSNFCETGSQVFQAGLKVPVLLEMILLLILQLWPPKC